jgi:hypothetical protein
VNVFLILSRFNCTNVWIFINPITSAFHLVLAHFFIVLCIRFYLSHLNVAHLSHCWCERIIDDLNIHLLQCYCESEHIVAHDIF